MQREYKSLVTNLLCVAVIAIGYVTPKIGPMLVSAGFFALSGAVTNWLAVYMLFEKVPLLYGSGVIPSRFQEFKQGIKRLIMGQFFTPENLQRFFSMPEAHPNQLVDHLLSNINFDYVYEELVQTILKSSFGGMLNLIGGSSVLKPLKEPLIEKLHRVIHEVVEGEAFQKAWLREGLSDEVRHKIEYIVEQRLNELTPQMVKDIIQDMIRTHLGWLVVWGGVFGGLMGVGVECLRFVKPLKLF